MTDNPSALAIAVPLPHHWGGGAKNLDLTGLGHLYGTNGFGQQHIPAEHFPSTQESSYPPVKIQDYCPAGHPTSKVVLLAKGKPWSVGRGASIYRDYLGGSTCFQWGSLTCTRQKTLRVETRPTTLLNKPQ